MSTTDLPGLAALFRAAPEKAELAVSKVVRRAAKDLRDDARELISGQISGVYLPHYAASITFEVTGPLSAEVGPDSGHPQGGMGRAIEFGSAKHGPLPHMIPAAEKIEESLPAKVAAAAVKASL